MPKKNGPTKYDLIKEDLNTQLESISRFGRFYEDLVDDYIFMARQKDKLQTDIRKNGIRYKSVNGNGIEVEKFNESYATFLKINSQMLFLLEKLNLKEPQIPTGPETHEQDLC